MVLLLVFLALALLVSFLCSILEAVLLSITPSFAAVLEEEHPRAGARLQGMKEDIDRPLAAILSLNTIAHTVGAAGVGAQAQVVFGSQYMAIISAVLTLLILVFSEIIPKTLGARYWRQLAVPAVAVLRWILWLLTPLVWACLLITRWLAAGEKPLSLSREEFSAMARQAEAEGVLESDEARVLHNLVRFSSLRVSDVLTPRVVVEILDEAVQVGELRERLQNIRFSRLPVYQGSAENITGFVLRSELLNLLAQGEEQTLLKDVRRDLLVIPETQSLRNVFRQLLTRREHLAMVVDEYGGFCGVVTLEDIVETLLGLEIMDEADSIDDMRKLARRRWLERAEELGLIKPGEKPFEMPGNS